MCIITKSDVQNTFIFKFPYFAFVMLFFLYFYCIIYLYLLKIYVENVDFAKKGFIFGAKCGIVNNISLRDILPDTFELTLKWI